MITVTIDGRQVRTEAGTTIIEAAFANGIYVPHFCWHPALSVSGNCRLCLVEVEGTPKQVIACATQCCDGMVVHINSDKAVRARAAVMEFILVNHPLDCPICDEAGECKLQDHAYRYGGGASRFDEEKNHQRKRVLLGPNVMFDAERCISCSRCIRFCEEIVGQPQLTFTGRGDRVTIETFPGRRLDNPYAMNVIELCPVGALTSVDFRFAARAWDMARTPGICPGCARGCNVYYWTKQNRILRVTPRENRDVNDCWMCDGGRLESWRHAHAETRATRPLLRGAAGWTKASWDAALDAAAGLLRSVPADAVAVVGSAFDSCEDNGALARLARDVLGANLLGVFPHSVPGGGDDILLCGDRTPNMRGARLAGFPASDDGPALDRLVTALRDGRVRVALVTDARCAEHPDLLAALRAVPDVIALVGAASPLTERASVLLPAAVFAETTGTLINIDGHLQLARPCLVTAGRDRWSAQLPMSRLDAFGTPFDRWGGAQRAESRPVWQIATQLAARLGAAWEYTHPEHVFEDLAARIPELRGTTYASLGLRGIRIGGAAPAPRRSWDYSDVHP